jgi:hypothetical protein
MEIDLREARWFGRERVVRYAQITAIAFAPTLVMNYLEAMGPTGSDFMAFWSAARLTVMGDPAGAYDNLKMGVVQAPFRDQTWFSFHNPPPFLAVVAPFGLLPLPAAIVLWVVSTYALWLFAASRLLPGAIWPIAAFPAAMVCAWHAQNGLLTAALLIGGVVLLDRRPVIAGILLGALVIKPHLALLIPVALIAARSWRAFAGAAGSSLGLLMLSWLLFGQETMRAFVDSATGPTADLLGRVAFDPEIFLLRQSTVFAATSLWLGERAAGAIQAVTTIGLAVIVWKVWRSNADTLGKGAVLALATPLATPYAFQYDLPLLIIPTCWWASEALRTGWRPWEKVGLAAFYWCPLVLRALALPLGVNLTPWALMAALAFILWRMREPGPAIVVRDEAATEGAAAPR